MDLAAGSKLHLLDWNIDYLFVLISLALQLLHACVFILAPELSSLWLVATSECDRQSYVLVVQYELNVSYFILYHLSAAFCHFF